MSETLGKYKNYETVNSSFLGAQPNGGEGTTVN